MRFNITKKIMLGMLIVVVAFAGVSIFTFYETKTSEAGYEGLVKRSAPLVFEVKDAQAQLYNQGYLVRSYISTGDAKYVQQFEQAQQIINSRFESLEKKLITKEGKQQLADLKAAIDEYTKIAVNTMNLRRDKGAQEAEKYIDNAHQVRENASIKMDEYSKFLADRMDLRVAQNKERVAFAHTLIFVLDFLIFIFAIGIAYFLARKIAKPLHDVVESAKSIAKGDLTVNNINYKADDEIGDLAKAFCQMNDALKKLIVEVDKAAEHVASSSQHLTASAEQSAQASEQVAQTVTEVATGAATQVSGIEQAVGVVRQMAAAIEHIAQNAGAVSGKSADTSKAAEAGKTAANQADEQMKTINNAVLESAKVIEKLGTSSNQIGQIVDVISGIAGQTNLLALNAAIEAARAGEQGRGFAVVAEEVRKLAEQSQQAALQIADLIKEIQSETDNAVEVMGQATKEVGRGTEVIKATGDKFVHIADLIAGLNTQIQEISAASEELSASSDEVVNSVDSVKHVAGQTASNTQSISAAAEEQSASMQEIASASQELSGLAQKLHDSVGQFRV